GYVAGSPLDGVDGWVQLQGTHDGATVVASPTNGGTQAARFSKASTTATSRAALTFDALTGNDVVLDFYLAFERTAGTTSGISNYVLFGAAADMVAGTGTPENAAVMVGFTRVSNSDQLVYRNGGGYVALGTPVSNEYYHFVV